MQTKRTGDRMAGDLPIRLPPRLWCLKRDDAEEAARSGNRPRLPIPLSVSPRARSRSTSPAASVHRHRVSRPSIFMPSASQPSSFYLLTLSFLCPAPLTPPALCEGP